MKFIVKRKASAAAASLCSRGADGYVRSTESQKPDQVQQRLGPACPSCPPAGPARRLLSHARLLGPGCPFPAPGPTCPASGSRSPAIGAVLGSLGAGASLQPPGPPRREPAPPLCSLSTRRRPPVSHAALRRPPGGASTEPAALGAPGASPRRSDQGPAPGGHSGRVMLGTQSLTLRLSSQNRLSFSKAGSFHASSLGFCRESAG